MSDIAPEDRAAGAGALVVGRVVYAFNWYNVGAVLPLLGKGLGANTGQLGIVLGAFLAGACIFQVPAGLLAIRWGYRTTSLFALVLMGSFCLASAFSPDWVVLAILRFGAGAGAAFFFAPALGLVSSYFPTGSRGPIIGIYNSGFALGSAVGLFAGAFIGAAQGWPWALAYGGIALLVIAGIAVFVLPSEHRRGPVANWRTAWSLGKVTLASRNLWSLALGLSGMWAAFYIVAQYFVQYASVVHPEWPIAIAAGLPTALTLAEVAGGPIGGWLGERRADMRRTLLLWALASSGGIALIPFLPLAALWPLFVFLGFAEGVLFAVQYLVPTYLRESLGETTALAIGFLNSVQLFFGSVFAVVFGVLVGVTSYEVGWLLTAAVLAAFLPLLLFLNVPRSGTDSPVSVPASP